MNPIIKDIIKKDFRKVAEMIEKESFLRIQEDSVSQNELFNLINNLIITEDDKTFTEYLKNIANLWASFNIDFNYKAYYLISDIMNDISDMLAIISINSNAEIDISYHINKLYKELKLTPSLIKQPHNFKIIRYNIRYAIDGRIQIQPDRTNVITEVYIEPQNVDAVLEMIGNKEINQSYLFVEKSFLNYVDITPKKEREIANRERQKQKEAELIKQDLEIIRKIIKNDNEKQKRILNDTYVKNRLHIVNLLFKHRFDIDTITSICTDIFKIYYGEMLLDRDDENILKEINDTKHFRIDFKQKKIVIPYTKEIKLFRGETSTFVTNNIELCLRDIDIKFLDREQQEIIIIHNHKCYTNKITQNDSLFKQLINDLVHYNIISQSDATALSEYIQNSIDKFEIPVLSSYEERPSDECILEYYLGLINNILLNTQIILLLLENVKGIDNDPGLRENMTSMMIDRFNNYYKTNIKHDKKLKTFEKMVVSKILNSVLTESYVEKIHLTLNKNGKIIVHK
jgi:hypothetical protein